MNMVLKICVTVWLVGMLPLGMLAIREIRHAPVYGNTFSNILTVWLIAPPIVLSLWLMWFQL